MNKVSVIIPTRNRKELLLKTIHNIENQSYKPIEIIIIDNGDDDTFQFLRIYYKDRVSVFKNRGAPTPGAARNLGMEIATGKYIQFFDSDDLMTANKIASQVECLEKSGANMVYGTYIPASETALGWQPTDVIMQFNPFPASYSLRDCMVTGFFTVIPACLFRADFLAQVGKWKSDIYTFEDWEYLWRIAGICSKPIHSNKGAMIYRMHGDQITGRQLNDYSRAVEKINCLANIEEHYFTDKNANFRNKMLLRALLYQSIRSLKQHSFESDRLKIYSNWFSALTYLYLRVWNKIQRLKTGSNWTEFHGISKDKSVFRYYLSLLTDEKL